jgi:predicted RNA-binding protein Jag
MKSIIEEASSIAKAIEQAWERAGKPLEFSIKVFQLPQKNFFGFTKVSAKIGIFFGEQQHTERGTKQPRIIAQKIASYKEQPKKEQPQGTQTLWTTGLCDFAKSWLQEVLKNMDKEHVSIALRPHRHILKVQFSAAIFQGSTEEERRFFGNLSYLMLSALRTKTQLPLKNMQISMRKS